MDRGTYNECNNPVSINASNGTKREYSWNVSTNLLSGYSWGIDSKNNVSLEWDTRGNIVSKTGVNRTSYSYDVLNRLVYESTNIRIEQKGSGLFTAGNVTDDGTGDRSLDYSVKNAKFDYFASSMGYDLNGEKKINSIELTGKSKRLDEKYVEIYVSDTGDAEDWTMVNPENIGFQKTGSTLKVIFKEYIETSYIKVHSTWDERDEDYLPVDKSEISGNVADIVEVFYLAEGKDSSWTYDAKGNRITSSERLGNSHSSKTVEYYANSDLIKKYGDWYFSYDKNGNLTARGTSAVWNTGNGTYDYSSSEGELWQYEYDLSNRMTRVLFSEAGKDALRNKASYTYDYRGLLVRKVTEEYVEYREYTLDGKLLFSEKGDETTDYIYKSDTVFAEVRNRGLDEDVYYHHTDHLGTTEAITDNNGTVVWEAEYEAFGSVLNQNGTKVFTASFTGKMYDAEAGMYYFNARWYDSEIGRFITQDPARDGANWYGYCNNNPLIFVDKTGLSTIIDENSGTIIAGIDDNDYGVYSVPTLNGERIEGPANKVGFTTRPDFAINPPERIEDRNEDTTKEKTYGYLFLLYRNDMGVNRSLRELGLLEKVKNAVDNNPKLTKNHGTVKQRFINQLKDIKEPKDAWFENSYSFLSEKFAIGTATVHGELDGIVFKNKDGSTHIEGVINYRFDDNFTDPYDLTNKIPGEWNPDGKPYKISDTWKRNINGDY